MDALSETLRRVRLPGAIFLQGGFMAPLCDQPLQADTAASFIDPGAVRAVIFHLMTEGECPVEVDGQPPVRLCAGKPPLARIAEDVGYQAGAAFSRAFRRGYGAPPSAWHRLQSTRPPA